MLSVILFTSQNFYFFQKLSVVSPYHLYANMYVSIDMDVHIHKYTYDNDDDDDELFLWYG